MARKRAPASLFALAIDGGVLLNARAQLEHSLVTRVARALGVAAELLFIGAPLPPALRTRAMARLDDAAAEAAARFHAPPSRSAIVQSSAAGRSRGRRKKM